MATTAVVALGKSSIASYAEYEQLIGGVETQFGDSSSKVLQYANNAYKTAGMSANEYMNTITSFSASLLQSLGQDTAAAAEYGNMAVTDMADNANKMGTNIGSIQDAYQGFAKQNYTMLDNLKLGYGGTKTEMERLIADANALNAAQGKATDYSIENFSDVVAAIHDVQTEMGITGTTAAEASGTIQGSVSAMKSAWTNFVTGLSNENADLGQLVDNLIDSAITAGQNINTRIQVLLPRLTEGLNTLMQSVVPMLPGIIDGVLPGVLAGATQLINSLAAALPSIINTLTPVIVQAAPEIISSLATALISNLPLLLDSGVQIVLALAEGIIQSLPELIPVTVQAIGTIVENLISGIPSLITVGGDLISGLWQGIKNTATSLFPGLTSLLGETTQQAVATASAGLDQYTAKATAVAQNALNSSAETIMSAASVIPADADTPVSVMARSMEADISMEQSAQSAVQKTGTTMQNAVNTAGFDAAGRNAMSRFVQGMESMRGTVMSVANSIAQQAVNAINSALASAAANASSVAAGYGSYRAGGLDYVPYNGYPSILHRGEAVLTAGEADDWRRGRSGGNNTSGITIIQNIEAVPQTPAEFAAMTAAYFEQARWVI